MASLFEPAIAVLTYVVVCAGFDEPILCLTLCLMVLALAFPGRNRFKGPLSTAAANVAASWANMNIAGSRMHVVAHDGLYRHLIRACMVCHEVKPCLTDWAQLHGRRGKPDTVGKMQARVEYDLQPLRNSYSLLGLDLQTNSRTNTVFLRGPHVLVAAASFTESSIHDARAR